MNTKRSIAVMVALIATTILFAPQVQAQTRVAIVDIGQIFKGHPQFSKQLEMLKGQADQFKAASIAAQQTLVVQAEELKGYRPDSPEYQALESKLAQESAAMEVQQRNKMRDLMLVEAKLHYDTYQQVNGLVEQYCDAQQIQLVLRYNNEQMDPKNPASVMQRVNSSVIFHNPNNDITQAIIRQLGGQASSANASLDPNRR